MPQLPNFSSDEWAAWVQAIGSIAAIFGAAGVAIHQAKLQHRNALDLHGFEKQTSDADLAKTLFVLATNSSKVMSHIAEQLNDREAVHRAAEGRFHCDVGELHRIDNYIRGVRIHTIPFSLVTPTMLLGSTVRQFAEKVEMALKLYRYMDAQMFEDFFRTMSQMSDSVAATCRDIEAEADRLKVAAK